MTKQNLRFFVLTLIYISLFGYISTIPRTNFISLFGTYTILFAIFFYGLQQQFKYQIYQYIIVFLAIRLPFFFNLPELSDDFFRFMWDGMLLNEGINPWGRIPLNEQVGNFTNPEFARLLLENMNSAAYASVYPTVNQALFGIAYFISGTSLLNGVNVMRTLILFLELSFYLFMVFRNPRDRRAASIYLLCPLTVIEGLGNVHLEALAVPMLVIALSEFTPTRYFRVALPWAVSVATKFVPLILGPMIFFKFPRRRGWRFVLVAAIAIFLLLGLIQPWQGFGTLKDGLGLYFQKFEFNASLYYLIRVLVQPAIGYNPIGTLGPFLAFVSAGIILALSYFKRRANLMELSLLIFIVFYLFSTTVHPWYLLPVVFFALGSHRFYILIWAYFIWLSYTHYLNEVGPKWWAILIEYLALFGALALESKRKKWLQPVFRG